MLRANRESNQDQASDNLVDCSCDGLEASLDRIMYSQLLALTGTAPW